MREPLVGFLLLALALGACAPHSKASLERVSASWAPEEGATGDGDAATPIASGKLSTAWDSVGRRLYVAGEQTEWLVSVDPDTGRSERVTRLRPGTGPELVRMDEARRWIWCLRSLDGSIRRVDVDSKKLLTMGIGSSQRRPIRDAAVNPATGWLWWVVPENGQVNGFSPSYPPTASGGTAIRWPSALGILPDGEGFLVVDAPDAGPNRLVRYDIGTNHIRWEEPLTDRTPPMMRVDPDGAVMLAGEALELRTEDGQLRWRRELPSLAIAITSTTDAITVLVGAPSRAGRLLIFERGLGKRRAAVAVGRGAVSLSADAVGGRVFVGKDDEILMVDVASGRMTRRIWFGGTQKYPAFNLNRRNGEPNGTTS